MRTLHVRVRQASTSALTIARHFAQDPRIVEVLYPGLQSYRGHAVAARQMQGGFGGMLSVRIKAGEAAAIRTAANVQIWKRATSLGGVESLIEHRPALKARAHPARPICYVSPSALSRRPISSLI
jgi:cystathionine gamma-synthase